MHTHSHKPRIQTHTTHHSDFFQTQTDVFQYLGSNILAGAWHGINTTLFAYGQTGSGKTHTMTGSKDDVGLIPRICSTLFYLINNHGNDRCVCVWCGVG